MSSQTDVLDGQVDFHALGLADLVARGLDVDVRVVAGQVLHQKRRHDAERGGRRRPAPRIRRRWPTTCRRGCGRTARRRAAPASDQRQHNDDDQHDRQRVAERGLFDFAGGEGSSCGGEPEVVRRRRAASRRRPRRRSRARPAGACGYCGGPAGGGGRVADSGGPRDRSPPRFCPTAMSELRAVAHHRDRSRAPSGRRRGRCR